MPVFCMIVMEFLRWLRPSPGCAARRDMIGVPSYIPTRIEKIVQGWGGGRKGARTGELSVRLDEGNEETDIGVGRSRGARGGGHCRRDAGRHLVPAGRRCPSAAGWPARRFRSRLRQAGEESGAGARRGARHRHADRERRHQGAARNHDHRGAFPRTAPMVKAGRSAVHARQPPDRGGDQARRGGHRRRAWRSSSRPSATCSATPSWWRRTPPRVVTLNNAQTQVNISRATAESNSATLENLKVQLDFTQDPRADLAAASAPPT